MKIFAFPREEEKHECLMLVFKSFPASCLVFDFSALKTFSLSSFQTSPDFKQFGICLHRFFSTFSCLYFSSVFNEDFLFEAFLLSLSLFLSTNGS